MDVREVKEITRFLEESGVCTDKLDLTSQSLKRDFQNILTSVKVPSGWEDRGYTLEPHHTTYKFRHKLVRNFLERKKSEGFKLTKLSSKQFFRELKGFLDSECGETFPDFDLDVRSKHYVDLFEQNIKLQGVVVWKSDERAVACVLVQKEECRRQGATGRFSPSDELCVKIDDNDSLVEGFHVKVAIGDIVEVTKCRRKKETALEPEIIKHFYLSWAEIESFLKHLSNCAQNSGSSATVTEIKRFSAVWEYILDLSKEYYTNEMILQILDIIDKICSCVSMSQTISGIIREFQQSAFFKTAFPDFVHKVVGEPKNVSLVQRILEYVIIAVPSCGLQVMQMATALAHNLLKSSSDVEEKDKNGHSAIDFLSKLSSVLASEVPGARRDVESLPWKKLPLIPVTEEIHKPREKTDDLPVVRKDTKYKSEEEYLNTYFRLLREECFYKLRKGINDFVKSGQKCDSKEMTVYRVFLRGCSTCHEESPTVMSISMEYELPESQDESEKELTQWLLYGSLLCISLDGTFQEPVWAVVEGHIASERIVKITLCEKANVMLEPQFIAKMQEITNKNNRAFMAESQTFYLSYAPAMEILQHRDHVPFKEYLVYPDPKHMEPPEYMQEIKHPPDWGIIFEKELPSECSHEDESPADYSLEKDFDRIRLNSSYKCKLDETQLAAVELALKNRLVLIQGPPGTGKSFVGVALVRLLLSMKVPELYGPILVVTYKNYALDNFLKECLHKVSSPDVKILRVGRLGNEDSDNELKKCLLKEVGRYWPERLFNQKRKLKAQIWALQPKVREAYENLRISSRFCADMFLKEASKDQIKCLLVDNKKKTVTEYDVDALINEQPKSKARLKELVEIALKDWLPSQEKFDQFVAETSVKEKSSVESGQQTNKDQGEENPNDYRDPSAEQNERLLALDEESPDEDDKEIAKEECFSSQDHPCLRKLVCLDENEVKLFRDLLNENEVWKLKHIKRIQLVYALQNKYFSKASSEFLDVSETYMQLHHQLKELTSQHNVEVMKRCDVIGMTVTGASIRANLLADLKPSVMIVEEAAEILEGQLVAVIPSSVQHLIMIGDHKQLKPVVYFQHLKKRHHLDLSMFERLVNCKLPYIQLGYQSRMRDEFVGLIRDLKIYSELKTHPERVKDNAPPACMEHSMYFWTHPKRESESKSSPSKRNSHEAEKITEVAEKLCREGGVCPSKITVLCSYRGQVQEITSRFCSSSVTELKKITVVTIDAFQGQENDIILLSLVRSNAQGKIGFLSSINRLCVAISRARCGLYLFGNTSQLRKASRKGWEIICKSMEEKGLLGTRCLFRFHQDSKTERHTESPVATTSASSPINITITSSPQANVIVAGNSSVNTINTTDSGHSLSVTTSSPHMGTHTPSQMSAKIPVQDPKSPLQDVAIAPTFNLRKPRLAPQDARSPTQVTSDGEKSRDLGEGETLKDSPVQESVNPKGSVDNTLSGLVQFTGEQVSEVKPVNKREEEQSKEEATREQPEVSTEDFPSGIEGFNEKKLLQETNQPGKDDVREEQPLQRFEEFDKEKPIQETKEPTKDDKSGDKSSKSFEDTEKRKPLQQSPGNETEGLSESKPLQETANSSVKTKSTVEEEVRPTQETVSPSTGHTEESDQDESKSLQETGEPSQRQEAKVETTEESQTGHDVSSVDNPDVKRPKKETVSSEANSDSLKEEAVPTQETMAAGKGPFEESGLEVGVKAHPRDEIHDVPPAENSESIQPKQETASSEKESDSLNEEAVPTQETMAAGKGPFEESGIEVGFKAHPTDQRE